MLDTCTRRNVVCSTLFHIFTISRARYICLPFSRRTLYNISVFNLKIKWNARVRFVESPSGKSSQRAPERQWKWKIQPRARWRCEKRRQESSSSSLWRGLKCANKEIQIVSPSKCITMPRATAIVLFALSRRIARRFLARSESSQTLRRDDDEMNW